jgi:hypothetical protein
MFVIFFNRVANSNLMPLNLVTDLLPYLFERPIILKFVKPSSCTNVHNFTNERFAISFRSVGSLHILVAFGLIKYKLYLFFVYQQQCIFTLYPRNVLL